MKNLKKIITIAAGTAAISAMAATASAITHTVTVSCYKSDEQVYKSGGVELHNYYNCGSAWFFDNANLYAEASTESKEVVVFIKFAKFGSSDFDTERKTTSKGTTKASYNPFASQMLEPTSYAYSQGDDEELYLRVTY